MLQKKWLDGIYAYVTMDRRIKYLDKNWYDQVFSNGALFYEIYPMDRKLDAGISLKAFITNIGVPEHPIVCVSK